MGAGIPESRLAGCKTSGTVDSMERIPTTLTIAGTDPTGGAGIIADVKTISALGGYALIVPTAVIAQNSKSVSEILPLPAYLLTAQLHSITEEFPISSVKIGLLPSEEIAKAIVPFLAGVKRRTPIVLDPVLKASSGQGLCEDSLACFLMREVFPYVSVITPNLSEAARLLQLPQKACTRLEMLRHAEMLCEQARCSVLLKGGHLDDERNSPDLLMTSEGKSYWFESSRIDTPHGRGTGCTLSSALAFYMIQHQLPEAVHLAKTYLCKALSQADTLGLVSSRGPLQHFVY